MATESPSAPARLHRHQLKIVGGKDETTAPGNAQQGNSLYPSIRKLPLLGVTFADLYRKTKVQEAVFETLTQEYEMAKVQEAKEIPSVKVLDPPNVPERKSFPPRTLITLLGAAMAFLCGVSWIFGRRAWEQTDPADPGKMFVLEVFDTVKAAMPRASRNGHQPRTESVRSGEPVNRADVKKDTDK